MAINFVNKVKFETAIFDKSSTNYSGVVNGVDWLYNYFRLTTDSNYNRTLLLNAILNGGYNSVPFNSIHDSGGWFDFNKLVFSLALYDENETPTVYANLYWRRSGSSVFFAWRISSGINGGGTIYDEDSAIGNLYGDGNNVSLSAGVIYSGENLIGVGIVAQKNNGGWDSDISNPIQGMFLSIPYISNRFRGSVIIEETSPEAGEPSAEGGYTGGTFDDSSDTISLPLTPTMGVTSVGFINVYAPTQGQLQQFGSELFPDLSFTPVSQSGTPSSVTDALVAMAQVLVDFGNQIPQMIDMYINSNLINYVIDCHVIPVSPQVSGTAPVKVGFKTFTPTPSVVTSDYVDFNCGTINVGEYYANFIDYLPYTRAKLYLPFVGFIDLAPEYWQSGSLNVTYRFNIIDGSFVAFVKSTSSKSKLSDSVIGQFGGNACVHIPITGLNYASMVSGIVGAMSPLLPSATGGVGDALVNSANAIANNKPNLQQSNGYNATTSFLTVRYPYLLIERSVSNFSRKYAEEDGIPSNITLDFSSLSGLTKATMLHLDGISGATKDDLDEIASLLSEGVIL